MDSEIKAFSVLLIAWLLAGFGALGGSILGNAFGKTGLFVGAVVGGVVASILAVLAATAMHWMPRELRAGAMGGAVVGFLIATPIAVANLDSPIMLIAITGLTGIGTLLGAGVARGRRQGQLR